MVISNPSQTCDDPDDDKFLACEDIWLPKVVWYITLVAAYLGVRRCKPWLIIEKYTIPRGR